MLKPVLLVPQVIFLIICCLLCFTTRTSLYGFVPSTTSIIAPSKALSSSSNNNAFSFLTNANDRQTQAREERLLQQNNNGKNRKHRNKSTTRLHEAMMVNYDLLEQVSYLASSSSLSSLSDDVIDGLIPSSSLSSSILINLLFKKTTKDAAQGTFWFCLGAGSGAGGIGLRQIPKLLEEMNEIKQLANESSSSSDSDGDDDKKEETFNGPMTKLWYPKRINIRDVQNVLKQSPTKASTITDQSTSTAYLATVGYLERDDYMNYILTKNCNPLATYAVFDALSGGKGSFVSPIEYENNLSEWTSKSSSPEVIEQVLDKAIFVKLSSFITLGFLLFLIFDLIIENFYFGWLS